MHSNSASRSKEFIAGFTSPLRVLKLLLEHPNLLALFILPMIVTLVAVSILIYSLLIGLFHSTQVWFTSWFGSHSGLLSTILAVLAGFALLYSTFISFTLFVQMVSSPFNDILAEKTEIALQETPPPFRFIRFMKTLWLDLKKGLLGLWFTGMLLLFGLIPGVGFLVLPALAFVQAFIYLAYPLSRREVGIRESVNWMVENRYRSFGFGVASLLLFWVPALNLFALPLSVMAGTLTYLKK